MSFKFTGNSVITDVNGIVKQRKYAGEREDSLDKNLGLINN